MAESAPTTAQGVLDALGRRWPPSEHVLIPEAPSDVGNGGGGGRKLDLLVASVWRSRGFELDGVEIKVSVSDWRRELKAAEKADWWWRHVNRFWLAAPAPVAAKIATEIPTGWGLLSVGESTKALVPAQRHEAQPLGWSSCLGLLRAAQGASWRVLEGARRQGVEEGLEAGEARALARLGERAETQIERELKALQEIVDAFGRAAGRRLDSWNAEELGSHARIGLELGQSPAVVRGRLERAAQNAEGVARELRSQAAKIDVPDPAVLP